MTDKDLIDPLRTKKGRIIMLMIPALFLAIFSIRIWNDSKNEPAFYFFLIYCLCLGIIMYKIWGEYYEFLKLYRKKINPNYPLTKSEFSEFYEKDPKIIWHSYTPVTLTMKQYKDEQLAKSARNVNKLFLIASSSPVLFFIVTVTFYYLRDL